VFFRKKK